MASEKDFQVIILNGHLSGKPYFNQLYLEVNREKVYLSTHPSRVPLTEEELRLLHEVTGKVLEVGIDKVSISDMSSIMEAHYERVDRANELG